MKKAMLTVILLCTFAWASDFYKLERVKRIEKDLYSAHSGTADLIIETKYCYEYATSEDAVLKYERYSYDNKIIFDGGTSCDVAAVYVK